MRPTPTVASSPTPTPTYPDTGGLYPGVQEMGRRDASHVWVAVSVIRVARGGVNCCLTKKLYWCARRSVSRLGETAPETQRALTRGAARRAAGARGRGRARGRGGAPCACARARRGGLRGRQAFRVIHSAVKGPRHITFIKQLNQSSEPEHDGDRAPVPPARATASPEPTPPSVECPPVTQSDV